MGWREGQDCFRVTCCQEQGCSWTGGPEDRGTGWGDSRARGCGVTASSAQARFRDPSGHRPWDPPNNAAGKADSPLPSYRRGSRYDALPPRHWEGKPGRLGQGRSSALPHTAPQPASLGHATAGPQLTQPVSAPAPAGHILQRPLHHRHPPRGSPGSRAALPSSCCWPEPPETAPPWAPATLWCSRAAAALETE